MIWTGIEIRLSSDYKEWDDQKNSILTLLNQMKSRKCKSALWYRTRIDYGNRYIYHILIAGLKPNHIAILDDLGYTNHYSSMSKLNRRKHFTKLEKNDNRTN